MKGRPSKPTNLKLVTGNPGRRSLNKNEPKPDDASISAPLWLDNDSASVWDEIAPQISAIGLLTTMDVQMLAIGCVAISQFRTAAKQTGATLVKSKVVENSDGEPVERGHHVNPWLVAQSMSFKQAMAVLAQFGMSPAARSRVVADPENENGKNKAASYFD
jgi:P27 family predicted phage terminase small subunit